jgi:hypothetical protein
MTDINLAAIALNGQLTVEEVNGATKEKLETDKSLDGDPVLFCASRYCGIEVVEAILDKKVNIDGFSLVSIVVIIIKCWLLN